MQVSRPKKYRKWLTYIQSKMSEHDCTDAKLLSGQLLLNCQSGYKPFKSPFESPEDFENAIYSLCYDLKIRLDPLHPFTSGKVDNFRFTVVLDLITGDQTQIFFRLLTPPQTEPVFISEDCALNLFYENIANYSWLICGPAGSGKTTFLKNILMDCSQDENVIVFDRYAEINIPSPNITYLTQTSGAVDGAGKFEMIDLFELSLRLNPTMFVIGELRLREFKTFSHSALSGHGAVFTTFHCRTQEELVARLQMMDLNAFQMLRSRLGAIFMEKDNDIFKVNNIIMGL